MPMMGIRPQSEQLAEAAAWLARLHADAAAPENERAFHAWLAEDPRHQAAFAAVTETWDAAGGLRDVEPVSRPVGFGIGRRRVLAGMGAVMVVSAALGLWQRANAGLYQTSVGEQRRIGLDDGSELLLDTDTRLRVQFDKHMRKVALEHGRVNCRVAADAARPFVIDAGGDQIFAQGVAIDVRRDSEQVSIVCLQGDALVETGTAAVRRPLASGQRLKISASRQVVDQPALAPLVAWHSGQAAFDNEPLADAVREMNRYSRTKLVVDDPRLAALRVSGTYHVGDNAAFAQSVASLLPVTVKRRDEDLVLIADPAQKNPRRG